ncbi:hypothetical protein ACHAXS_004932 [Conticribra weissflogii]
MEHPASSAVIFSSRPEYDRPHPRSSRRPHPSRRASRDSSESEEMACPSRGRHRRRQRRHDHDHDHGHGLGQSSPLLSQLTLLMIAVASASNVAAGISSSSSLPCCCFASAARPVVVATTAPTSLAPSSSSSLSLSLSAGPPLSTLLAPLASVARLTFKSSRRTSSSSSSSSSSPSPSSVASSASFPSLFPSSDVSSLPNTVAASVAAVVPPPDSRLARLKNRNRGRTSGASRTDLRYANDDGEGTVVAATGGYAPYERWMRSKMSSSSSPSSSSRRTWFAATPALEPEPEDKDGNDVVRRKEKEKQQENKEEIERVSFWEQRPRRSGRRRNFGKRARLARFLTARRSKRRPNLARLGSPSPDAASAHAPATPPSERDYRERQAAWAAKYTSVATLRSAFGTNKNRLWGDFDPKTTRRLYHALLPRALLGLHDMGLSSVDELAPLAYQARVAAKKYARERSMLPGRIGSMLYDGFRQWKRYGKFDHRGMTWEQVWRKYEDQVLREAVEERMGDNELKTELDERTTALMEYYADALDDEELTTRICLRILERSVVTNEAIDRLFLKRIIEDDDEENDDGEEDEEEDEDREEEEEHDNNKVCDDEAIATRTRRKQKQRQRRKLRIQADLKAIEKKFDDDIRELLLHGTAGANGKAKANQHFKSYDDEDKAVASRNGKKQRRFFFSRRSKTNEDSDWSHPSPADSSQSTASFARGGATSTAATTSSAATTSTAATTTSSTATSSSSSSLRSIRNQNAMTDLEDPSTDIAAVLLSMSDFEYHRAQDLHLAGTPTTDDDRTDRSIAAPSNETTRPLRTLAVHEVFALRILASTKRRIASLHSLSDDK